MENVFEKYAQEYDAWFDEHDTVYQAELAAVRSFLPPAGLGVEIGVGSGRFAAPLGVKFGLEPAWAMAKLAQKRGLQVIQADAAALPLATASFDFALLITVLCFLPDPWQALREATRILKPGGRLIIGLIDPDSPLGREYEARKAESRFYRQAVFQRIDQVWQWLANLGYEDLACCQTIFGEQLAAAVPEPVLPGSGQGAFVVIAGRKPAAASCQQGGKPEAKP